MTEKKKNQERMGATLAAEMSVDQAGEATASAAPTAGMDAAPTAGLDAAPTADELRDLFAGTAPVPENRFRDYAVLVPLIRREDGIHVLYEVRARDLDRQPGEICFPGGMQEPGETWQECALRETKEEIGLAPEHVEVLNELTVIYGVGRFAMHCFLGLVDGEAAENLQISSQEVDQVFTVPLRDLLDAEPEDYRAKLIQYGPEDFPYQRVTGADSYPWSKMTSPVPVYDVNGWAIWGLTGRVTKVLVEEIRKRRK